MLTWDPIHLPTTLWSRPPNIQNLQQPHSLKDHLSLHFTIVLVLAESTTRHCSTSHDDEFMTLITLKISLQHLDSHFIWLMNLRFARKWDDLLSIHEIMHAWR